MSGGLLGKERKGEKMAISATGGRERYGTQRSYGRNGNPQEMANIHNTGLYTDESPGLKVDPVVVLVLSLGFIFSVVALHSTSSFPLFFPSLPLFPPLLTSLTHSLIHLTRDLFSHIHAIAIITTPNTTYSHCENHAAFRLIVHKTGAMRQGFSISQQSVGSKRRAFEKYIQWTGAVR